MSRPEALNSAMQECFVKLHSIWDEMGVTQHVRDMYSEQAQSHIMELMDAMVTEAHKRKNDLCHSINLLNKEIHDLAKELKTTADMDDFTNVPLLSVESALDEQVKTLKQTKQRRLRCLEELRAKESQICQALGVQPIRDVDGVPSYEELENFKLYLEEQEAEKNRMESMVTDMRRTIVELMDELAYNPDNEFENLIYRHPEKFVYTASNMAKLRELRDNLKATMEEVKATVAAKHEELAGLWKYLDVPENARRIFLEKYSGHRFTDIQAINDEIRRCKEKRSENIAKYVEKVREDLKKLWDLCKLGPEERHAFRPFYIQTYTENLLNLHDCEVERLREHYNKNRKLYQLVEDYESFWEKVKELDKRSTDPERLHNRGGQLLIEEKERKALHKKFPKLEEQINTLAEQYGSSTGETFMINGMPWDEYFKRAADERAEAKEGLKKARLAKAKDKSMRKTPTMSTSRRTPATTTSLLRPGYTSVRKRDDKSPLGNSAKRRQIQSEKSRPTVCTTKTRRSGRVPRRLLKAINSSNRSMKKGSEDEKSVADTSVGSIEQYEDFQEHLKQHEDLRSSVLPEQVLKNAREKSGKMRTPVKTPAKPLRKNMLTSSAMTQTPKSSYRAQSQSPRAPTTPRLTPAPTKIPFFF